MTYSTLTYAVQDGVAVVTLNRPDQMNSFTVQMAEELAAVFAQAGADDSAAAVVLTGAGRAFCAGMDLSVGGNVFGLDETLTPTNADMRDQFDDPAIAAGVRDTGGKVTLAIYDCPKPVIAAINGAAVGIGATMTLACDFRLVSEKARIGFVFGRLGITMEACSSWFLPRLVGMQQALEWIYTADVFDAEEAKRGGLARSIHAPDDLMPAALAMAHKLTDGRSQVSTALARQMLQRNSALASPLEAHRVDSLAMFYTSIGDGKEGVKAFLEKRPAEFASRASAMPPFYPWWDK